MHCFRLRLKTREVFKSLFGVDSVSGPETSGRSRTSRPRALVDVGRVLSTLQPALGKQELESLRLHRGAGLDACSQLSRTWRWHRGGLAASPQ